MSTQRQPVHCVYGGAHLYSADTTRKLGSLARQALQTYAPTSQSFASAVGIRDEIAESVYERVLRKLEYEPVEDYHIDFEDGYGCRPDEEEDRHAVSVGNEVARTLRSGALAHTGIRIKPLDERHRPRSTRTLELFLRSLVNTSGGYFPAPIGITLPKVSYREQVEELTDLLETFEARLGIARRTLFVELMVETTEALMDANGACPLRALVSAARGRCRSVHFGAYDYTSSCGITAACQRLQHPACDFARSVMQLALAGTGVWLSDGGTNVLPVPVHKIVGGDGNRASQQAAENQAAVHNAWRLHYSDVRHALASGFFQGWDFHPAQLPSRYAAVYSFFLEGMTEAATRLRNFLQQSSQATRAGAVFDDAATGRGLMNFFHRAVACGAITESEAAELVRVDPAELPFEEKDHRIDLEGERGRSTTEIGSDQVESIRGNR